ncbi:MAG: LiaF-related protein [Spirochaetia bacterium]
MIELHINRMEKAVLDNIPEKRKYGVPEYRDKIVRRLETAYADNKLELEEYEKRLDQAYRADFIEDLEMIVHDFPGGQQPVNRDIDQSYSEGDDDTKVTLIGDQHLTEEDFTNKKVQSLSILGDVNIDIRRFRNYEEPIRIKIFSVIGDTRIIIPRGMKVKNRFKSLLGDYELLRNNEESFQQESFEECRGTCILEGFSLLGDISIQEEGSKKKGFLQKFFKG